MLDAARGPPGCRVADCPHPVGRQTCLVADDPAVGGELQRVGEPGRCGDDAQPDEHHPGVQHPAVRQLEPLDGAVAEDRLHSDAAVQPYAVGDVQRAEALGQHRPQHAHERAGQQLDQVDLGAQVSCAGRDLAADEAAAHHRHGAVLYDVGAQRRGVVLRAQDVHPR